MFAPSCVRWSLVVVTLFGGGVVFIWLGTYPSVVRWCLKEEFGTPRVVTNPPRWRFPWWELVDWKSFTVVKAGM